MPRGGARAGAGRPKSEKERTKTAIYKEDREILNSLAKKYGYTVHEFLHKILHSKVLEKLLQSEQ